MDANTPATQSFSAGDPTRLNPVQDSPGRDSTARDGTSSADVSREALSKPVRPKGPNASAIVLGLVAMAIAAVIIGNETMGLQVDWSRLGPGAIVGIGLLLVVLGAVGLVRRHDDL